MNTNNYAIAVGRLTGSQNEGEDVKVFENKDGSRKVRFNLAVQNNYKGKDGKKASQFLPFEALISAKKFAESGLGVFARIHKGDKITVLYDIRNNNYKDKDGNDVYGLTLFVEQINLEESKTVVDNRLAARAAANGAAAEVPAE